MKLAMGRRTLFTLLAAAFLVFFASRALRTVDPERTAGETEWVSFGEAFEQAGESRKLLLIDIYEIGCRFCRAMEREVYPSEPVQALIDRHFIPVRVDGRSDDPIQWQGQTVPMSAFALEMNVSAYPHTVIMSPDGRVLDDRRGYMDILAFSQWLRMTAAGWRGPSEG